jgi:hypothetical protein
MMTCLLTFHAAQGVLRTRQGILRNAEEEHAAATASEYGRIQQHPGGPGKAAEELQTATPELAGKLKQRQTELDRAQQHQKQQEAEAAAAAAGGVDQTPGWTNSSAPYGSELASLLAKR